jgi:hypothetical protein
MHIVSDRDVELEEIAVRDGDARDFIAIHEDGKTAARVELHDARMVARNVICMFIAEMV